jgi:hypothetical protein
MREPPPNPWVEFPNPRDAYSAKAGRRHFSDWMEFLFTLSLDELCKRERDYPPPPEWGEIYNCAKEMARNCQTVMQRHELIEKIWQVTTLK